MKLFCFLNFVAVITLFFTPCPVQSELSEFCLTKSNINEVQLLNYSKVVIPNFEGKRKGEAGKIGIIGGSLEYTGAPYFAAISALKVGADLVYVITTKSAAPVIKSYSPELIVYPFLDKKHRSKISNLLPKMDVVIIGPGLGREYETTQLIYDIIQTCKNLNKPMIVDADGLFAISENISIIKDYPNSGVILTPNHREEKRLMQAMPTISASYEYDNYAKFYDYWGENVAVLAKGETDKFNSKIPCLQWSITGGGSGRRAGGQGDILAGVLGTFYNWAIKLNPGEYIQQSQSIASYAAAKFTRACNSKAFALHGRSMTASDMIYEIHHAFQDLFDK